MGSGMSAKTVAHDSTDVLFDRRMRESGGNKETEVLSVISGLSWVRRSIAMGDGERRGMVGLGRQVGSIQAWQGASSGRGLESLWE